MTWQELVGFEKGSRGRKYLRAFVEKKDGERWDVQVVTGAVDTADLKRAEDALKSGEEVWVDISFKRFPHVTDVKVGSWE